MTSYRVTFFKNLVNSNGHESKCQQGSIEIRRARSDKRALKAAQRRYERANSITHWTLFADVAELEAIEPDGSCRRFLQPASREHFALRPDEASRCAHLDHSVASFDSDQCCAR